MILHLARTPQPLKSARPTVMNTQQPHPDSIKQPHPDSIGFWYSIAQIRALHPHESASAMPAVPTWRPPRTKESFEVVSRAGWHRWSHGHVRSASPGEAAYIQPWKTTTLFWCKNLQAMFQVPYDCTKRDISGTTTRDGFPLEWEELSFDNSSCDQRHLSLVRYHEEGSELGARASLTLVPNFLPEKYQNDTQRSQNCGLAGDLATIVGMAAFSTSHDKIHVMMRDCFRGNGPNGWEWQPGAGSKLCFLKCSCTKMLKTAFPGVDKRGYVVTIGVDRRTPGHLQYLKDWQDGKYGSILS